MVLRRIAWSSLPSSVEMFIVSCRLSPTQLLPSVCWKGLFLISIFTFPHSMENFSESANKNSIILTKTVVMGTSPTKSKENKKWVGCVYVSYCWMSSGSRRVVGILTLFRQNVKRGHKESNTADKYNQTGLYLGMRNILRLLRIALQMLPVSCHNSSLRLYRLDWEERTETKP